MQAASSDILHDQDHILGCVDYFIKADDMYVPHLLHELDFSLDALSTVRIQQLYLLVNLHGDLLVRGPVEPDAHDSICPLTNLLTNNVVIERVLIAENHTVIMRICHVRIMVHLLWMGLWTRIILHLVGSLLLLLLKKLGLSSLISGCSIVHMLPLSLLEL